jgi:hypothetical protein
MYKDITMTNCPTKVVPKRMNSKIIHICVCVCVRSTYGQCQKKLSSILHSSYTKPMKFWNVQDLPSQFLRSVHYR